MEYTLKRLLTYKDVANIEDFMLPERVQDCLYELYVVTNEDFPIPNTSFVRIFNEAAYLLTCIFADKTAPEHVKEYLNDVIVIDPSILDPDEDEEDILYYVQRYIFSYVWLVLKTHINPPKHAKFFLIGLESKLQQENSSSYARFKAFLSKHPMQHELEFSVHPDFDFGIFGRTTEEWKEVTFDFDKEAVAEIVSRFHNLQSRALIIHEIRGKLDAANRDPNSSRKVSLQTQRAKADDAFMGKLLQECDEENAQREEQEQAIEKSKDERIAELEKQVKKLTSEKREAIRDKEDAERERDEYRKKWEELNSRLNKKYIPAELKSDEAKLIIEKLIKQDLITPLGHHTGVEFVIQTYRWDGTGALFGYFVDRMNYQLELADSGGRINWKPFKHAFSNYEEKEKRARDTVSYYKQHPKAKMPEKAEKIDDAIAEAEKKLKQK